MSWSRSRVPSPGTSSRSPSPSPALSLSGSPAISILLLLPPASTTEASSLEPVARPTPLATRQSSSRIQTLSSLREGGVGAGAEERERGKEKEKGGAGGAPGEKEKVREKEIKAKVMAGRRLSLGSGPGIGIGLSGDGAGLVQGDPPVLGAAGPRLQRRAVSPTSAASAVMASSVSSPSPASAVAPGAVPTTATEEAGGIAPGLLAGTSSTRSSIAAAGSRRAQGRPGWEADELVGNLRGSGLEVMVVRHAAHLPALLDPARTALAPIAIARPAASRAPPTRVVLLPLADSPALPALSLLLHQGTTPSAVCFQQDILARARRQEDEWLAAALAHIRSVADIGPAPLIIAYSSNSSLSQSAIAACVAAGAIGVLRPPYNADTAEMVRRMVKSYRENGVGMADTSPPPPTSGAALFAGGARAGHRPSWSTTPGDETDVVLPPTALDMGNAHGEYEGEKVLSAVLGRRRRESTETWGSADGRKASIASAASLAPSHTSTSSACTCSAQSYHPHGPHPPPHPESTTAHPHTETTAAREHPELSLPPASQFTFPYLFGHTASFCAFHPAVNPRRRSVDVGGLALAIKRASRLYEGGPPGVPGGGGGGGGLTQVQKGFAFPSLVSPTTSATPPHSPVSPGTSVGATMAAAGELKDGQCKDTELAELLGLMYYQTGLTVEVQMGDYDEFSAPLTPEHRAKLVDELATWNFQPHNLPEGDLFRVACLIFEGVLNIEGLSEFGLERDKVNRLLFAIRAIYHAPNPYHNYVHAIDVLQATYTFLVDIGLVPPFEYMREWAPDKPVWRRASDAQRDGDKSRSEGTKRAREIMRPQDVLAVLVAAMGHDVGHPGLSNAFMKNARVPLSQVYEDKSVLENMHCMLIVQLLRKHGFSFLFEKPSNAAADAADAADAVVNAHPIPPMPPMSPPSTAVPSSAAAAAAAAKIDRRGFRKVLYSSILATDMSVHFAWIQRLKEFDERLRVGVVGGEEDDRILICQAFIKCADISNPSRPINVSQHWSSVLLEEWAKQASLEQDLSLPVSVVASADAALQAKGQIGFIDLFTRPLFEAVSEAFGELQPYTDSCVENQAIWKDRLAALTAQEGEQGGAGAVVQKVIQPPVEGASHDDRFKTLFPLLLPTSLLAGMAAQPEPDDPVSPPPLSLPAPAPLAQPASQPASSTHPSYPTPASPPTPSVRTDHSYASYASYTAEHSGAAGAAADHLPAASVMRAVYHARLMDHTPNTRVASWSRGFRSRDWTEIRRMSTPEVQTGAVP